MTAVQHDTTQNHNTYMNTLPWHFMCIQTHRSYLEEMKNAPSSQEKMSYVVEGQSSRNINPLQLINTTNQLFFKNIFEISSLYIAKTT